MKSKLEKTIATFLVTSMIITVLPNFESARSVRADVIKNSSNTSLGTTIMESPVDPRKLEGSVDTLGTTLPWAGSYVYFGSYEGIPLKFRVLAPNTTAYGGNTLFLDCDSIITSMNFDDSFQFWNGSEIQSYLNDDFYYNSFTPLERSAVYTSIGDGGLTYLPGSIEEECFEKPVSINDKVFLLDASEILNPVYGYSPDTGIVISTPTNYEHEVLNHEKVGIQDGATIYNSYWLRSANKQDQEFVYLPERGSVGAITGLGIIENYIGGMNDDVGVSPAINIDLSSVLFTTRIKDGIYYGNYQYTDASGITHGVQYDNIYAEYKLTLKDPDLSICVQSGKQVSISGTTVTVPYSISGANASKANRVSVLITDPTGTELYYYEELNGDYSTTGVGTFSLYGALKPEDWGTKYNVYIVAEDTNDIYETDYASEPVKVDPPGTVASYTVSFNSCGGSTVLSQTVIEGNKATKPADPTKSGYTFGGWYTNSACTTAYNFNAAVTADITLYAKWTAVSTTPAPTTPTPAPTTPAPTPVATSTPAPVETPKLTTGIAHVQDIGDVSYTAEAGILTIGTTGMGKRLEQITINFENNTPYSGTLQYRVHVQNIGWMEWTDAGQKCGTEGQSLRIEAIEIRFTGELADYYSVEYCVHIQDYGDMQGWVKDGALAGTTGESKRIEELKIRIVPKNSGSSMSVKYRVHVQDYGWEKSYATNGAMSGTSGESKRLEGIEIFLSGTQYSGGIKFKTHVQDYGWQGWSYDGEMSGTQGESKRLEGICIELYGEVAEYYDIYYRVHAQDIGWMGWAKNGECAGTAGRSARLEGIQIVLVPKGSPEPSATYEGITAVTTQAFKEGF